MKSDDIYGTAPSPWWPYIVQGYMQFYALCARLLQVAQHYEAILLPLVSILALFFLCHAVYKMISCIAGAVYGIPNAGIWQRLQKMD